jgi:hypothetical protein
MLHAPIHYGENELNYNIKVCKYEGNKSTSVSEFIPSHSHPIVQILDSGSLYIYTMHILHVLQSYSM